MSSQTPYLTVAETAEVLEISPSGVYKLIQRGQLKAVRKTAHGMRISRLALDAYQRRFRRNGRAVAPVAEDVRVDELREDFVRDTGMTPTEWERRWKADEIEDTAENMRRTVRALALRAAERDGEITAERGRDPVLSADFTRVT